jgi:SAM-dependent methyltransferase
MPPEADYSHKSKRAFGIIIPLLFLLLLVLFIISISRCPIVVTIILGLLAINSLLGIILGSRMHAFKGRACALIAKTLGNEAGGKVLDIGTGTGILAIHLAKQGLETIGIDTDADRLKRARENASASLKGHQVVIQPPGQAKSPAAEEEDGQSETDRAEAALGESEERYRHWTERMFRVGDGSALKFKDQVFDAVTSLNLLHETKDPRAVVAESHRVLKPGGMLAMADMRRGPATFSIFWFGFFKFISKKRLSSLLHSAGFSDVRISKATPFHHLIMARRHF